MLWDTCHNKHEYDGIAAAVREHSKLVGHCSYSHLLVRISLPLNTVHYEYRDICLDDTWMANIAWLLPHAAVRVATVRQGA
jgi:hypothetical protein